MTDQTLNRFLSYGTNAQRLAFVPVPPTPASGPSPAYLWREIDTGDTYIYDTSWHLLTSGSDAPTPPQGRLTLTSGTPVLTSDVTAATAVIYALYNGNKCPIAGVMTTFAELSQNLSDNTKQPAAIGASVNFDAFVWNDGGTVRLCLVSWTAGAVGGNDTARGTGANSCELQRANGIWTNKNALTNGPGANAGTYVGTGRSNSASKVDFILGGTGVAGGESTILGLWNCYNRVLVPLINYDTTDSWNYTVATWRIRNNNNNNKISLVVGMSEDELAAYLGTHSSNASSCGRIVGIGLNSVTAYAGFNSNVGSLWFNANVHQPHSARFAKIAPLGFNYLAPLEYSEALGTTTWYGDDGANGTFTGETNNGIFQAAVMA